MKRGTQHDLVGRRGFLQKLGAAAMVSLLPLEDNVAHALVSKDTLCVLTCNIRVDLEEDAAKGLGWQQRRSACLEVIRRQQPAIIGFQEVLYNQFADMKAAMPDYHAFGFDGPEMDSIKTGYHGIAKNPVFFSKKRFELLAAGAYWLSETPLIGGSISWGSARARNACWVRLYDRYSKKELRLVNLHLDHVNAEAKLKQIALVLEESAQYADGFVQIMTGDFNVGPESQVYQKVVSAGWKDTFTEIHGAKDFGGTTHGFKGEQYEKKDRAKKIDFIFTKGAVVPRTSAIVKDNYKGVYPSDHYFLRAELEL
ncbi:endonuclease/exonuclease/phosphatase family protein [Sphingobacterium thalpophilum]|uniref:endonuclease/exonuclease/phosphatase family protein n=1 Tax=Sphingobacterium thalpophilum TaxID=259 RepID=UPI003C783152